MDRRLFLKRASGLFIACAPAIIRPDKALAQLSGGAGGFPGPGTAHATATGTTWDPANKAVNITLSNGNLTASNVSGITGFDGVRGVATHATGQYSYEVTITTVGTAVSMVGVCNGSYTPGGTFVGQSNSIGLARDGTLYKSGTTQTINTYTAGDVVTVAFDATGQLIWFRTNSGNWNNSGTAVPFSSGGISTTAMGGTTFYPALSTRTNNDSMTANFTATPPAGGSIW